MAKKGQGKTNWERDTLQAVIVADSFNVRFSPLSLDRPRALMPLCNTALLDHTLHFLEAAHVDEVIVFCCSFSQQIQEHLSNSGSCRHAVLPSTFWQLNSRRLAFVRDGKFTVQTVVSQRSLSFGDALREIYQSGLVRSDFILVRCFVPVRV